MDYKICVNTTLTIRDLNEPVTQRLIRLAADHGRSVEDEAREILTIAISAPGSNRSTGGNTHTPSVCGSVRGIWKGRRTTEGILNLTREG